LEEEKNKIEDFNEESDSKRQYNKIDINQFYINDKGEIEYCQLCKECIYDCKTSFRINSIMCPKHNKVNKNNTYRVQRVKNKLSEKELAKQIKKLIKEYEDSAKYKWNFELYKEDEIDLKINESYVRDFEKNECILPYLVHKAINKVLYGKDI
jgi:HD superfamily phosphohydrolase